MTEYVGRRFRFLSLVLLVSLLIFSFFHIVSPQDVDNDGLLDSEESQLASTYAPFLHFAAGERFFPVGVGYHMNNSALYLKSGDVNMLIDSFPTSEGISLYQTGDYFLNNTLGSFDEIADDYEQRRESLGYTVYARVAEMADHFVVQYWFFYAFNPGTLNQHQGDWEMVEVILDSARTPLFAAYSQHFTGERAFWSDVERTSETHPVVYVALGSHASYFRACQGKIGLESDIVGDAFTLGPDDYQIVLLGERGAGNHLASQSWLEYGGRWGDWTRLVDVSLGAAGPRGPGHGENEEKWFSPVSWGSDVFLVDQTWFNLSWVAFHFLYFFAVVIAALAALKVWRIVKRRKQGKLNIMKILRSKAGIGVVLGIGGVILYLVGILLPWYVVSGSIQTNVLETVGETDLVLIDGVNGLRVNTLQRDQGLAQLFGLGIPFGIILLSSVVLNFLDVIGVEKAKALSRTYIISGFTSLVPVIIILVFIIQLANLLTPFAEAMGGGAAIPPQIDEMARRMSSSPILGEYSGSVDSYGNLHISWGLGIGSYLFIAAAITKLVGGVITRKAVVVEELEVQ